MPCISPDGKPTKSGLSTLTAIDNGASTPTAISDKTGQALFRVKSGLRELVKADFVKIIDDKYSLTEQGKNIIST